MRKPAGDAITRLSYDNYVEMRSHTASRMFLLQKRFEVSVCQPCVGVECGLAGTVGPHRGHRDSTMWAGLHVYQERLHQWFPEWWIPLYTMVAFPNTP